MEPQRTAANISADLVKLWLRSAMQHKENVVTLYYTLYALNPPSSLSLSPPATHLPANARVHTFTRTHNGCSKFFQGISRLINRLVV